MCPAIGLCFQKEKGISATNPPNKFGITMTNSANNKKYQNIPVLPLRDVVVYPYIVTSLFVGRDLSINAIKAAIDGNKKLLVVAQKKANIDKPKFTDLYKIATVANILQLLQLPNGTYKILVEGETAGKVVKYRKMEDYYAANVTLINDIIDVSQDQSKALIRATYDVFAQYVKLNKKINHQSLKSLKDVENLSHFANIIATHLHGKIHESQAILETINVENRLEKIMSLMQGCSVALEMEKKIHKRVQEQTDKNQREYYLNEQIKAIQKELGEMDNASNLCQQLESKIAKASMPKEARQRADAEIGRLKLMSPTSGEAAVIRNYIDWLVQVPWKKSNKICQDLQVAEQILEADHYGLEKIKERILEYLAVQQRNKKPKGSIICLVGPPGVGKTSLGKSIARAVNRKYTRMALGGVRDEAEIRGHRRTYIGSMPGKILQNLAKIKSRNPLFLLDEIDKMSIDFRGDPSSALLEVLDPEQNNSFADHYLEVDFDLSDVMFVATANTMNIPPALLDRMEVIRLAGYTQDEKINIASRFLLAKQVANSGLKPEEISIAPAIMQHIIRFYTREAGVRGLEREIAKICRKVVKKLLIKPSKKTTVITRKNLSDYLGVERYDYGLAEEKNQIGRVTGLAWTQVGGELLTIETAIMPGKGKQSATGKLGSVMKESIEAAVTVVRSRAASLGISDQVFQKNDIHIHVPEGATPKDGPSAGVGMCTAIVSALSKIPVKADVAMTGEITLRGEVLPIGGLKEKLLAAHQGGIATVLIPAKNEKDLSEIPANIKKNLHIVPISWIDEVLMLALQYQPTPIKTSNKLDAIGTTTTKTDKYQETSH